jgi:anti-sigma factor RsiW
MHRGVRDKLEDILACKGGLAGDNTGDQRRRLDSHLSECAECRDEVAAMRDQHRLFQSLRSPEEAEPRAGFYARVIERIEAQGATSIWNLFFDSPVGRGLAMASMLLALSLGMYLVSSERGAQEVASQPTSGPVMTVPGMEPDAGAMLTGSSDRNAVLWNLVTYREQ